jgi:hypothetical protein
MCGNKLEARRVAALISQMYTESEKRSAIGIAIHCSRLTPETIMSKNSLGSRNNSNRSRGVAEKANDSSAVPVEEELMWTYGKGQPNGYLPAGRLLSFVVPFGHQMRGVLLDHSIEMRFKAHNVSLVE